MSRILIIGGYGAFGAHAARRLARQAGLEIVIAGRSAEKAARYAGELAVTANARIEHAAIDATAATPAAIRALEPRVLINASGPFQAQGHELARAAIAAGCHYIDLADDRAFVAGISALDAQARAAGVCVVSGASSVPGLSSAVVQHIASDFAQLDTIEIGISPGNSFDPGLATTASILSHVGKPHAELCDGSWRIVHGWQGLRLHRFPSLGPRLMASVDVPDLELLPARHPSLRTVRFAAGLEVPLFHLGLWGLSWLARAGIVRDLSNLAGPLLASKRRLRFLGTDQGGMFVRIAGRDRTEKAKTVEWHLIARAGHGPYVPAIPSVILARQLCAGNGPSPGAAPCVALFTLAEFEAEVADLSIALDKSPRAK